ncbi:MAG: tetratricopeptide repeat protein [Mycobacteriales bacterium]
MPSASLKFDRVVLAAAVVLTCILFTAKSADPVNVIKLTALLLGAIALVASAAIRVVQLRVAQVPWGLPAAAVAALLVAFVVATVTAPVTTTAVLGAYGRNSGLLAYASAIVLFLAGLRLLGGRETRVLVSGVVIAGLFTATYGLLQLLGWDSVPWNNPFNPVIASLGNPDFASGYLGIAAPVAVGGALWKGWDPPWRIACAVTAGLCLLTAVLSSAVQGPIAAAGGLAVVTLAVLLDQPARRRRIGLAVLGSVAALGAAVLVLGATAQAGPAKSFFTGISYDSRSWYWGAAVEMFGDRPALGVGLDQYGNYWRTARSAASVAGQGGTAYSDSAHSIPLQMFAQGGLLLGLTYLAFVGLVGWALVRGLLRLSGPDRILLAAVGGGWAAYQVQSIVSIDQVPLIVLHFALAGGVVAAAGAAKLREVRLPGAPKPVVPPAGKGKKKGRPPVARPRKRTQTNADHVLVGGIGVVALVAAFYALVPLRADSALQAGNVALSAGDRSAALEAYRRATDLTSGRALYWSKQGQFFQQTQQPDKALAAFRNGVRADDFEVNNLAVAAAAAEKTGDLALSRELYERAVRLDPWRTETLLKAATFELRHDGTPTARIVLEDAVDRLPTQAALWATLGQARAALGDAAAAREAYERALALQPGEPTATDGLAKLAAS